MDFHSMQTEKIKAMARYRLLRNITKIRLSIEFMIVVFLILWSSARLPSTKFGRELVEFVGKVFHNLYGYACSSFVSFAVFHTIIIFLFLYSCVNRDGTSKGEGENPELTVFTDSDFEILYTPASVAEKGPEAEMEEKQNMVVEDAVMREECEAARVAIEEAKRQMRWVQRTHSAIWKRGKPHRELRGSGMDINLQADCDERAISEINKFDSLSSKEFQRRIDEFIVKQQRLLLAQKMAEQQLVEI